MADYFSTTVVQPKIPLKEMTATEYLLLCGVFDHEIIDRSAYFFAETGPSDMPELDVPAIREAMAADAGRDCQAMRWLQEQLDHVGDDLDYVAIDMSEKPYEFIIQDIIRRSRTLSYVWVITSYHCSEMRADGFGGVGSLITADQFRFKSTDDIVDDFLVELFPDGDPKARRK